MIDRHAMNVLNKTSTVDLSWQQWVGPVVYSISLH